MNRLALLPALLGGCLLLADEPPAVTLAKDPGPALDVGAAKKPCTLYELGIRCVLSDFDENGPLGSFVQLAHSEVALFGGDADWIALDDQGHVVTWDGKQRPGTFTEIRGGADGFCAFNPGEDPDCWGGVKSIGGSVDDVAIGDGTVCFIRNGFVLCDAGFGYDGVGREPEGKFKQVVLTGDHACALRLNGSVACWGDEAGPPLGGTFVELAAGEHHVCGLRENGSVDCWGANASGQRSPPDEVFVSIDSGPQTSCGVTEGGEAVCWGEGKNPP